MPGLCRWQITDENATTGQHVTIARDGTVVSSHITRSSGNPGVDRSVAGDAGPGEIGRRRCRTPRPRTSAREDQLQCRREARCRIKPFMRLKHILIALSLVGACGSAYPQIEIDKSSVAPGNTKPIWLSMSGLTGRSRRDSPVRPLCPGLRLYECGGGAVSHQRQQRREPASQGRRSAQQEHAGVQGLLGCAPAAAGARVRR